MTIAANTIQKISLFSIIVSATMAGFFITPANFQADVAPPPAGSTTAPCDGPACGGPAIAPLPVGTAANTQPTPTQTAPCTGPACAGPAAETGAAPILPSPISNTNPYGPITVGPISEPPLGQPATAVAPPMPTPTNQSVPNTTNTPPQTPIPTTTPTQNETPLNPITTPIVTQQPNPLAELKSSAPQSETTSIPIQKIETPQNISAPTQTSSNCDNIPTTKEFLECVGKQKIQEELNKKTDEKQLQKTIIIRKIISPNGKENLPESKKADKQKMNKDKGKNETVTKDSKEKDKKSSKKEKTKKELKIQKKEGEKDKNNKSAKKGKISKDQKNKK